MGLTSSQEEEKEANNQSVKKTDDILDEQDPLADPLDISQVIALTENSETKIDPEKRNKMDEEIPERKNEKDEEVLEKKNEKDEEVKENQSQSPKIQTTVP